MRWFTASITVFRHHSLHTFINYDFSSNFKTHHLLSVVGFFRLPIHSIPSQPSSSSHFYISSSFSLLSSSTPYDMVSTMFLTSKQNSIIFGCLRSVHRHPSCIIENTSSLLSSNCSHQLHPKAEPLMLIDGSSFLVLMLQGILPMTYPSMTYQMRIDMHLPPQYPICHPIIYVTLVSS